MKKLIIEQLKEGFLFSDENDDMYAVSSGSLSKRVSAYFGMTRHDSRKKTEIKKTAKPHPSTIVPLNPEMFVLNPEIILPAGIGINTGAISLSSSTEQLGSNPTSGGIDNGETPIPSETKLGTPDNKLVQSGQCAEIQETPGFNSPAAPSDNILHPSDLKIAKFDYDNNRMQEYKSLEFLELPDGRVVLKYGAARYYTSKDLVMQIPFPFSKGQFNKENGWSSTVEQAFKMYRRYLAGQKDVTKLSVIPTEVGFGQGQPDGTCDDVSFDTCANNDPEACKFCVNESRYEDKRKLAAKKPRAPLLKASMGV